MSRDQIIITSEVRLYRNLDGFHFLDELPREGRLDLLHKIMRTFSEEEFSFLSREGHFHGEEEEVDKDTIWETYADEYEEAIVEIGEEEHLLLRHRREGLELEEAYYALRSLDEKIEHRFGYAFDERWGYLMADPKRAGTGFEACVLMHLPALNITQWEAFAASVEKLGFSLVPYWGEGEGNLFEVTAISNWEEREEDTMSRLEKMVAEILDQEMKARKHLYFDEDLGLSDLVWRAFGALRYARLLDTTEVRQCLSGICLGLDLSLMKANADFDPIQEMYETEHYLSTELILSESQKAAHRARYWNRRMKEVF